MSILPRLQLIELMDQSWFPAWLRRFQTDNLHFIWQTLGPKKEIAAQIASAVKRSSSESVVDLCSGSGGMISGIHKELVQQCGKNIPVVLTDLYPNTTVELENGVTYWPESVDARSLDPRLTGVRTMFTSLHHFPPDEAKKILLNARECGQPIAVYELTARTFLSLAATFFTGLIGTLLIGPFIRPFSVTRLFFTYIVPLVPLTFFFDGVVSVFRTYTAAELLAMVNADHDSSYNWESGILGPRLIAVGYLLGFPKRPSS